MEKRGKTHGALGVFLCPCFVGIDAAGCISGIDAKMRGGTLEIVGA